MNGHIELKKDSWVCVCMYVQRLGGVKLLKAVCCGGSGRVWGNVRLLYKDKPGMTHLVYIIYGFNLELHYRQRNVKMFLNNPG